MRPSLDAGAQFAKLLAACESLAVVRGVAQLTARVNTARREAYQQMLAAGFRIVVPGLAIDRPDEAAYY